MLWAYQQRLDPLQDSILWSPVWSTALAALPVVTLFWLLVFRRWLAPKAAAAGAVVALLIAIVIYQMPADMALLAFADGAAFGLMPVGWTIFSAMLLYNVTVETGHFAIVRRSVAGLSGDARIQAVLIGFAFGAFLEGAAGGGTPVAICGAIMVGLGFDPFLAAVLCLIANTSPVAYGGLGTPLIVLSGVTDLPAETLSIMAGHQLPLLSFFVPAYMVKVMCSWRQTWEVWPALLVSGGSFAMFQFTFATIHAYLPGVVLWPMTDIGGGIFSLVVTAIFLNFWRPRHEWHYRPATAAVTAAGSETPLTIRSVSTAWAPYALMSVFLLLTGLIRQQEPANSRGAPINIGPVQTNYLVPVPALHEQSLRDPRLHPVRPEALALLPLGASQPLGVITNLQVVQKAQPRAESALFNFPWLTAPGTPVFVAALVSMVMLRMNFAQVRRVFWRTCIQMKIPIPTIACMLGLSYVTRYAGMDATLGVAFAETGLLYPFFAPILGWLGVFLTGTDAGSNALFGSLQKITATQVYLNHPGAFAGTLDKSQLQVLISVSNSTGGVMGKMIDAQSICVATAATDQIGKEADIFKAVVWHSILLAATVGLITLLQAYVYPFVRLVPRPP
jgi:lactate permease